MNSILFQANTPEDLNTAIDNWVQGQPGITLFSVSVFLVNARPYAILVYK